MPTPPSQTPSPAASLGEDGDVTAGSATSPQGERSVRSRVSAATATIAAIGAYGYVMANGLVRCPLAAIFHVPCPTCGATRSTLALVSGDWRGVLLNPVAPLLVMLLGGFAARLVYVAARDGNTAAFDAHPAVRVMLKAFVGALLVALGVWIARFFGLLGGPVAV